VDRTGGVDLEAIAAATRAVSAVLDGHDPMPGQRYTLEVSSPGVERRLRTPSHFQRAVGETVSVRTAAGGKGERRVTGRLKSADDEGFVLEGQELPEGERRLAYDEVERARTVFEWGSKSPAAARQGGAPRQAARSPRAAPGKPAGRKKVATP
jgi:ribosome maturation factor RimP